MIKRIVASAIALLCASFALAARNVPGGVEITVQYQEPNLSSDGSPISDLLRTSVFYNLGQGDVKLFDQPASSPNGNGNVNRLAVVPFLPGRQQNVTFYAVAVDSFTNLSVQSNVVVFRFDTLAPGAPRVLQISGDMLFYRYDEPSTTSDGGALDDLSEVRIFFNDARSAQVRHLRTVPATSTTGGGSGTAAFPLDLFARGGNVQLFTRYADSQGNVSAFPQPIAIRVPN
ncbi:MAG TPA: hypothetical protein VJ826_15380 [Candidatus Polarisedimenticolaceae bacterium]|nr:hypothetical protein [Candidatus Polarisedimenticolaceae bacterium]